MSNDESFAKLKANRAKKSISKHYHESLYQELTWVKYLTGNRPHQEKIMGLELDHFDEHQLYLRFKECFVRFPSSQKSYTLIKSIQKFKTIGIFCAETIYMLIYVGVSGYVDQIPFHTPTESDTSSPDERPMRKRKVNLFEQQIQQEAESSGGLCSWCCPSNPNAIQRFNDDEMNDEKDDIYNLIDRIVNIYPFDPVLLVITCIYMEELITLLQQKFLTNDKSPEKTPKDPVEYAFSQPPEEPTLESFDIPNYGHTSNEDDEESIGDSPFCQSSFVVEHWHSIELYFLICFMLACKTYGMTNELPMMSSVYFDAFRLPSTVSLKQYNDLERAIFGLIVHRLHISSDQFVAFLQKPHVHRIVQQQIEDDDSHSQLQLFTTSKVSQRQS